MAAAVGEEAFGWDNVDFVEPLPKELECPVCLMALKQPLLTACGHRYCTACIEKISKDGKFKCPLDNNVCSKGRETFLDRDYERRVRNLKVKCSHSAEGCLWVGELSTLQDHIADGGCDFESVECPFSETGCHHKVKRRELKEHKETNMSQHMDLLLQTVSSLKRENESLKAMLGAVRSPSGDPTTCTFFWRIRNWSAVLRDAKNHTTEKIFSDGFYTDYPGYKLCLGARANGKPGCLGSHIYVYVHIMKGEYDDLLKWPFQQTFKLSIVSQEPIPPEKWERFRVVINANDYHHECLERPKQKVHEAGLYCSMASHQELETLKCATDDALLIKIEVPVIVNKTESHP